MFEGTARLPGQDCLLGGAPDFLIREDNGYVICDVKMSRRINDKDHPEILWQLRLYGWLFEQATGQAARRLEVLAGTGEIVEIEPLDEALMGVLEEIVAVTTGAEPPFSPVGWSKCNGCGYYHPCWAEAERTRSVALVPKADQGLTCALRDTGIISYDSCSRSTTWTRSLLSSGRGECRCARLAPRRRTSFVQRGRSPQAR